MKKIIISATLLSALFMSCKDKKDTHASTPTASEVKTTVTETVEKTEAKAKDLEEKLEVATQELNDLLKEL